MFYLLLGLIHNEICYPYRAYFRDIQLQDELICRLSDDANFFLPNTDGIVCSATNDDYPGVICPVSSGIARLTVDPDLFTDNHTGNYLCCPSDAHCASPFIAIIYG